MEHGILATTALVVLTIGMISRRLQHSVFTPPMLFTAAGFLVGPAGLGIIHPMVEGSLSHAVVEFTLIVLLFTDGASLRLCDDVRHYTLAMRLLGIGMLLSILFGSLVAYGIFPELGWWDATLLAAVLTPTDAALGQVAFENPSIPKRIRQNLLIESGLNDGLIVPVILFLSVCSSLAAGQHYLGFWVKYLLSQIGFGIAVGVIVARFGGWLVAYSIKRGQMSYTFEQLSSIALAALAFSLSEMIYGNGLVAAFVAGITFGCRQQRLASTIHGFADAQSQLLTLITFFLFGAVIMAPHLAQADWRTWLYALLSLGAIRMAAALISLIGSDLDWSSRLFIGWMGPRGVASLLFGLVVFDTVNITHREEIFSIVVATVTLSIFLHGISALPLSERYNRLLREPPELEKENREPLV